MIILDHQTIYELWRDPLFWESASAWEDDRDLAEFEVAAADATQSSLSIKHCELYNDWITELERCFNRDHDKLQEIIKYIRTKRYKPGEQIILPPSRARRRTLVISNGVEKCQDELD